MSFTNLTNSNEQIDFDDSWSDEDLQDLTTFGFLTTRILMNQRRKKLPESRLYSSTFQEFTRLNDDRLGRHDSA